MDGLDYSILIFLWAIGSELCTKEGIYSALIIGSIILNDDGVVTVNLEEGRSPVFWLGGEGFEYEHVTIEECQLNISWIAGGLWISWHWNLKFEVFHMMGKD
uniref:Uncharacterized protein n=1 Tax=Romanomermis culicivorax TaxID=13658 RepID=A0A915JYG0_ROMCU